MPDQPIQLTLLLETDDQADPETVDDLARRLRHELSEMPFVEEASLVQDTAGLHGSKGGDTLILGALTISFLAGAAPALATALHHWSRRGDNNLVKIQAQLPDRTINLQLPTQTLNPTQLQQIVDTLLSATTPQNQSTFLSSPEFPPLSKAVPPSSLSLSHLTHQLQTHYNLTELQLLAAELAIEWENLPGPTRAEKALALVTHCHRHGRLPQLVELGKRTRPGALWETVTDN